MYNILVVTVSLQHHSYRSFQGFLCLMQISTRTCDYIVDCIALRQHLQQLNTVFTDPSIVKVCVCYHDNSIHGNRHRYYMGLTGMFNGCRETLECIL